MSSSTSSSEPRSAARRFLALFVRILCGAGLSVAILFVLADPYDTARMTPLVRAGVPETGPRTANASRIRNVSFNAAIIGNSTIQLISPERLDVPTGMRFVQLSVPGTGPMEQVAILRRLFTVRGEGIKAIVIGLETSWCEASRERRTANPFPFGLYDDDPLTYVRWLFRMDTLEFLVRRLRLVAGLERPARPDGYRDYEVGRGRDASGSQEIASVPMAPPTEGRPAATEALRSILDMTPASTRIVLVHPPVFVHTPSRATAEDLRIIAACKAALQALARRRPMTETVDFWVESELSTDRRLFLDHHHYRQPIAVLIEAAIATALTR